MPDRDAMPYRPCVGIMLINRQGLVWMGNRIPEADTEPKLTWQMPQGGIDEGEAPHIAAHRELHEETGVRPEHTDVLAETRDWMTYDLPDHLIGKALKGKFRGQRLKFFAMRFLAGDDVVDLEAHHQKEFSEWAWTPVSEITEMVVPFKQEIYRQVVAEFAPLCVPMED